MNYALFSDLAKLKTILAHLFRKHTVHLGAAFFLLFTFCAPLSSGIEILLKGGPSFLSGSQSISGTGGAAFSFPFEKAYDKSFDSGLEAAYLLHLPGFFVGASIDAMYGKSQLEKNYVQSGNTIKSTLTGAWKGGGYVSAGLGLIPLLTPFLKAGMAVDRYRSTYHVTDAGGASLFSHESAKKTSWNFAVGGGLKTGIGPVSVVLEYMYLSGGSHKDSFKDHAGQDIQQNFQDLRSHKIMVGAGLEI